MTPVDGLLLGGPGDRSNAPFCAKALILNLWEEKEFLCFFWTVPDEDSSAGRLLPAEAAPPLR